MVCGGSGMACWRYGTHARGVWGLGQKDIGLERVVPLHGRVDVERISARRTPHPPPCFVCTAHGLDVGAQRKVCVATLLPPLPRPSSKPARPRAETRAGALRGGRFRNGALEVTIPDKAAALRAFYERQIQVPPPAGTSVAAAGAARQAGAGAPSPRSPRRAGP